MKNRKISIIVGDRHSGKTTRLLKYIDELNGKAVSVAGIVAIGSFKDGIRDSFLIKDITTNTEKVFMTRENCTNCDKIGGFYINNEAYKWGVNVLHKAINSSANTIVIDEVGQLELNGNGWYTSLLKLLKTDKNIVITVRDKFLDEIVSKFKLNEETIEKL